MNTTRRIGLSLTAAIGLAGSALAADQPASKDGLLIYPNVRVENATPADAKVAKTPTSGMHAYIDPTTGKLRAQTVEEAQAAATAPKAKLQTKGLKRQATTLSADSATTDDGLEVIYGPDNAVGVKLNEEFLSYQVVHKTDNGLQVQEVTGLKAANKAAKAAPVKNSTQEVSHER